MMKRSAIVLGIATVLAGCGHNSDTQGPVSLEESLVGHVFELKEVDGNAITAREVGIPSISFMRDDASSLRVAGRMCNSFMGPAILQGTTLTSKGLGMTRMLCGDDMLNTLDHDIGTQLEKGTHVEFANGKLTLKGEPHTLVYHLKVGNASAEQKSASSGHH